MWCCTCCCKSIKKRHDKAEAKAKKKELKEKEIELDRKLAKLDEAGSDKGFTERKLVPVGADPGSAQAPTESEEIKKLRRKLKKEKKQRLQAENELKFNQTIQSARGGGVTSVFDLDSIQGGGVYSSGTESSSEDSQAAKRARKSKNKLKRVKSKTVENVKVERQPKSESDSNSLSRGAEQDGKESHAKSRPTLDKISRMEAMMAQLMEENRTLK